MANSNICFCNKPMTVWIWRGLTHQHWGSDAALQLPKQLVLLISQRDYLLIHSSSPGEPSQATRCLVLASGELIPGFRRARGSHRSSSFSPAFWRLGRCTGGMLAQALEHSGRSTGQGVKDPVPKPSYATGAMLLGSESDDVISKVLALLEEPHPPH